MRHLHYWVLMLFVCSVGCHRRAAKNATDAKEQEVAFARIVASMKFDCDFSKITLDEKNKEVSGNTTIYPGDACGTPIVVICETSTYRGKPAVGCGAKKDTPSKAIADNPIAFNSKDQYKDFLALVEPCRLRALSTYPEAKERYLAGLPKGYKFLVMVRLKDQENRSEQVFVSVDKIYDAKIDGKIENQIELISGYRFGQVVTVQESEIVDWLILAPDGSEEGNLTGKYMDAYQASGKPPKGICDPID